MPQCNCRTLKAGYLTILSQEVKNGKEKRVRFLGRKRLRRNMTYKAAFCKIILPVIVLAEVDPGVVQAA